MTVRVRNKVELQGHIDANGYLFCMMEDTEFVKLDVGWQDSRGQNMVAFSRTNFTSRARWLRDFRDGPVAKAVPSPQGVEV